MPMPLRAWPQARRPAAARRQPSSPAVRRARPRRRRAPASQRAGACPAESVAWRSFLLLPAHGDRSGLAILEVGDPFGYGCVAARLQQQVAAVEVERACAVVEIEVVQDSQIEHRGAVAGIERDRLLVSLACLRELARLAIRDAELVPVDRLTRAELDRSLERAYRLGQLAGLALDQTDVGVR